MNKYLTRETDGVFIEKDPGIVDCEMYIKNAAPGLLPEKGGEAWKLDVGAECNELLKLADRMEDWDGVVNCAAIEAIRSIVRRVAEFESLETE
jgi:hypothetical protein